MSEINWNEAPEGATHWSARESLDRRWHKIEAGTLYFFGSQRRWIEYMSDTIYVTAITESLIPRPEASQIPPVGTVCEYSSLDGTKYYECEILGRNKELVWIRTTECDKHHVKKEADFKFRPIPTEEELAVEHLSLVLANQVLVKDRREFISAAKAIYKAGYRKV